MSAIFGMGIYGCLYGGFALVGEFRKVPVWIISLLVLEPVGLVCLAAVFFILMPGPMTGRLLAGALGRARPAAWLFGIAFALDVAFLIVYLFYSLLKAN